MRHLSWLVTLTWVQGAAIITRSERGQYAAEAWEQASSIRDNILEEARISLEIPHRTEYAVLFFWYAPEDVTSE